MTSRRRTILGMLVLLVLASLSVAAFAAASQDSGEISGTLGRQLVLVSPQPAQLQALGKLPVTVHTYISSSQYLASGQRAAVSIMGTSGITSTVLDPDTRGKVYYFLDAQAGDAARIARNWGRIVYSDAQQILLAVPAAREKAFLDAVGKAQVHIELLTNEPIYLGERPTPPAAVKPMTGPDPAIQALLGKLSAEKLSTRISDLSGVQPVNLGGRSVTLKTRYTFAGQVSDASAYVRQALTQMGLQPQDVPWTYGSYSGVNIVADLRGTVNPERIWLIGGHYDDRSQTPYTVAPGADDNATGVSSMLVIADILRTHKFRDTIRFVAFSGEEQGMWGSKSYAARLSSGGVQVMGFIDVDMMGWDGNNDRVVEIHSGTRPASVDIGNAFVSANTRYATGLNIEHKQSSANRFSDHSSFWDKGFASIMAIENFFVDTIPADHNPYYHNTGDVLSRVRLDYLTSYAKASLATLAELAGLDDNAPATATATASPTAVPSATATASSTPASPSATPERTATAAATATPVPSDCRDIVVNGSMEQNSGWSFGSTARRAAYSTAKAFAGARSMRNGIEPSTADRVSHSSAFQRVTIPAGVKSAVLTAHVWRSGGSSGDYQEILLLNTSYRLVRTLWRGLTTDAAWQPLRYDVTNLAGQTLVLYLNVYNNGDGRRTWMYSDDVTLAVCTK